MSTIKWEPILIDNSQETFNILEDDSDFIGNSQIQSFLTLPCIQKYNVIGMSKEYAPVVSLYITQSISDIDIKSKIKSFSCIQRIDTYDGYITVIFNKKPEQNFYIQFSGV